MKITFVGVGLGNPDTMTVAGSTALQHADLIIGSRRLVEELSGVFTANRRVAVDPAEILQILQDCDFHTRDVCVVFSGDTGFYSGAKRLLEAMPDTEIALLPGISSPQYFASCLGLSWQNWKMISAHAAPADAVRAVMENDETFFLTGAATVRSICRALTDAGLGKAEAAAGERLSYRDEAITVATAAELAERDFDPLSVLLVRRCAETTSFCSGIADEDFVRGGQPLIPMTKEEVRAAIVSRLRLRQDDTVYDIGAGTGSVSVQMAMAVRRGAVYAVERSREACELLARNRERFGVGNLKIVEGVAPAALVDLPRPDAVFIGGTRGRLQDILPILLKANPVVRVCISAVTLEGFSQALQCVRSFSMQEVDVIQIQISRSRAAGEYTIMGAQNPVWLICAQGAS